MKKPASRDSTSPCCLHSLTFHWDWDLDTLITFFFLFFWNTSLACGVQLAPFFAFHITFHLQQSFLTLIPFPLINSTGINLWDFQGWFFLHCTCTNNVLGMPQVLRINLEAESWFMFQKGQGLMGSIVVGEFWISLHRNLQVAKRNLSANLLFML